MTFLIKRKRYMENAFQYKCHKATKCIKYWLSVAFRAVIAIKN